MSEGNEVRIWASPEVREKNLEVYNQKKEKYNFWKNLMIKFVFAQIIIFLPFMLTDFWLFKAAFWIANIGTFVVIGVSEYHRHQLNKAAKGNW